MVIKARGSKPVARAFYVAHGFTFAFALGFCLCAFFANKAEDEAIGRLQTKVAEKIVTIYYVTAAIVFVAASIGITAQYKGNRPCMWILYCTILGVMTVVELSVGGSALGKASNLQKNLRTVLYEKVLEKYTANSKDSDVEEWDKIHDKYKCCGIESYKDWQQVNFGRTSLKVPTTCCLPEKRKNDTEYCGINLLPENHDAAKLIYVEGCLPHLIEDMTLQLTVMGYFGIVVSIIQLFLVGAASYFMITKKL